MVSSDQDEIIPVEDPGTATSWKRALAVALGALGLALASLLLAIGS